KVGAAQAILGKNNDPRQEQKHARHDIEAPQAVGRNEDCCDHGEPARSQHEAGMDNSPLFSEPLLPDRQKEKKTDEHHDGQIHYQRSTEPIPKEIGYPGEYVDACFVPAVGGVSKRKIKPAIDLVPSQKTAY